MKKSYLTLAAVAAIMASCSNEVLIDEPVEKDVEIGFANGFMDNMTKAELTNDWFKTVNTTFGVFGYKQGTSATKLFSDETVTRTTNDWTHPTVRFWDKSAKYDFYAYAPASQAASFSDDDRVFSFSGIVAKPIIDITTDDADLAIATPKTNVKYSDVANHTNPDGKTGHGAGHVEFTFNHILSKLSFKAKTNLRVNADKSGDVMAVTIKKIELDFPTATSASWTQTAAGAVDGTTSFGSYAAKDGTYETVVFPTNSETQAITENAVAIGKTFIVAPVNTDNPEHVFGVKVTYDITYNDNKVDPDCVSYGVIGGGNGTTGTQYKPTQNSNYVVTLVVGPEKIEFCVDKINDWDTETGVEVTVND